MKQCRFLSHNASPIIKMVCTTWLGLLLAGSASAQSIDEPLLAFSEGRYIEAADGAEALGTSEGYALAAKSLAIYGHYLAEEDEKPDLLNRAMQSGEEAVRADAGNPQAHLESAHAMGRYTQAIGTMAVKRQYANLVRNAIETALRLDPEMVEGHVSLATWHAEAISGGGFMAKVIFGANKNEAIAHYEQALALAPDSKAVLIEYAMGLLLLNKRKNAKQAHDLLTQAIELPVRDAFERLVHDKAVAKLAELDL